VKRRLFVAADLDDRSRAFVAAAIERLAVAGLGMRYAPREKWHITVAFLGDVEDDRRCDIEAALASACADRRPFEVVLDHIGAFPSAARPRVVWVGSSTAQRGFDGCATAVRSAFQALGFRFDDPAVPHVTVSRLKHRSGPLPVPELPAPVTLRVDALTLYESVPAGPTTAYRALFRAAL